MDPCLLKREVFIRRYAAMFKIFGRLTQLMAKDWKEKRNKNKKMYIRIYLSSSLLQLPSVIRIFSNLKPCT